jgi:hypothetical protein
MIESTEPRFVNREPQISTFCDLLKSARSGWVMLVRGDPAMGKTRLLKRFKEECQSRSEMPPDGGRVEVFTARVDFGNQLDSNETNSTVSLIRLLCDRLDQPSYFGRLAEKINLFTGRGPASDVGPLQDLVDKMEKYFSIEELRPLSRHLDVPHEKWYKENELESENAYLMASYFHRRRRLPDLIAKLEKEREHVDVDWRQGLESLLSATGPGPDRPSDQDPAVDRGDPLPADGGQDGAIREINRVFFECIRSLPDDKRVVFLFDGCGLARDAARDWIREQLLARLGADDLQNVVVVLTGEELVPVSRLGIEDLVVKEPLDLFDRKRAEQFLKLNDVPMEILNLDMVFSGRPGVTPGFLADIAKNFGPAQRDRHVS